VAAQESTGTIEGSVIDSMTRAPVAGAQVSIGEADAVTDAAGGFRFEGIEAKRYALRVTRQGYPNLLRAVYLAAAGDHVRIVVRLTPLAEIEGHVLDEDGRPMAGVLVYSQYSHAATTNEEGYYRATALRAGEFTFYCRLVSDARHKLIQRNEKTGEVLGYADTYYFPGLTDPAMAAKVKLTGGVQSGFDFRLRRGRLVEFSGKVVDRVSGAPLRNAAVELDPGNSLSDEAWKRRNVDAKGAFRFELIAPGRYALLVYRNGATGARSSERPWPPTEPSRPYRLPVEVGPAGLTDRELRIPENVDLQVSFSAPHPEKTQGGVMILVGGAFGDGSRSVSMVQPPCRMEEKCVVRGIPPGEWRVDVSAGNSNLREAGDTPRFLYIGAVRFGGQDAWGKTVTVAEGGNPPLEIVLTAETGAIAATVANDEGRNAPVMIVARREDGTAPMRNSRNLQLDGLPPGEYQVAAFVLDDGDPTRILQPRACGDRMATVTVTAGQTSAVNLKPCVIDPQ